MRVSLISAGIAALFQLFVLADSKKAECSERVATACGGGGGGGGRGRAGAAPVCGTDNLTYESRCALLRLHCRDAGPNLVAVKHRGRCKESQPCWSALARSNANSSSDASSGSTATASSSSSSSSSFGDLGGFSPRCLADGRYAPVQCDPRSGYCWCVTRTGRPLPDTSRRGAKPKCNRRGKTRRGSFPGETKNRKDCSRSDRSAFVTNLVKIFRSEYIRQPHVVVNQSEDSVESDRRVVDWKFNSLDVNGDSQLSESEYWALRELVRKVVRPKRCSRSFSRACDLDQDNFISKAEWTTCLALDMSPGQAAPPRLDPSEDDHFGVLQESVVSLTGHLPYGADDGPERKDDAEVSSDCLTDRQAVLDEMRTNNNEMYIPECTADGRYLKVQCYRSTGYCWCVNEDSGTTIPGTSVKDNHPKCDSLQPLTRPMKGCPEQRKQAFLRGLMDFLTHTMATQKSSVNVTVKDSPDMSPDERIAAWNFNALDTNKNKVLEKGEWKSFRTLVSSHRKLRRCGKKLPRYCDVNRDHRISLSEWLACLDASQPTDASVAPTPNPKRKGPNPLESYLKGDDK